MSKHISFLLPSLKFGGAERVVITLAEEFCKLGYKVDILLMSYEGEFLEEAVSRFNVVDLNCNKTYKLPFKILVYLFSNKPDVIISSFWKLNLCSCLTRIMFPFFKLLLWEHALPSKSTNHSNWIFSITASIFYQFATKVVVVSTGVYADIVNMTFGTRHLMTIIFNPISPPKKRCANRDSNNNTIISVGRLELEKNHYLLFDAFAIVTKKYNTRLIIVGSGSLKVKLEFYAEKLGISDRIEFVGFQSDPYIYISKAQLLVLSSDHEGFGNVIVEALYCGLSVVSTDSGRGIHDILLDGKYGTIVPCNDKIALSQAIMSELKFGRAPDQQKQAARRFSPHKIAKDFLEAME